MTETPRTDDAKRYAKLFSFHSQQIDSLASEMAILERENAALREDKATLDWLEELYATSDPNRWRKRASFMERVARTGFRESVAAARRASP